MNKFVVLSCVWLGAIPMQGATLISHSDTWHYRKGTSAPPINWTTAADADLDASWSLGPGGFGYGDNDDATVLADMRNGYLTVYIRRTFTISAPPDPQQRLQLAIDWDDGYVAYLDGDEVARSSNVPGAPGTIHPHDEDLNSNGHEAGTSVIVDLGRAADRLSVGSHILAIQAINDDIASSDLSLIADLLVADPPPGTITQDTIWRAADSPMVLTTDITVIPGVTLTIEPGVTVRLSQGRSLFIQGRLLAEGTPESRIIFAPGAGASAWGTLEFSASPWTNRLAFVDLDGSGGNIDAEGTIMYLDNIWFTNTTSQVIDLVNSSVTLRNTFIPGGAGVEPVHFSNMPAAGHALIEGCVFDAPRGYNDSIDFTGGNRPGPIPRFINNVFLASVDDCFDMDGTDAHIEGNVFLNVRKDGDRSSSSNPITTGAEGNNRSELVICRNIFYNCEHAFMEKDLGQAILQNNTILRLTPNPLSTNPGEAPGIILFGEPWRGFPFGNGAIFEGNIAADLQLSDPWPQLAAAQAANPGFFFVRNYNCLQGFPQPGIGNIDQDPMFTGTSGITPDNIRQMLALLPASPCRRTGPNDIDMGALVPAGASISGAPSGATAETSATLTVAGPGIWGYRWRPDGAPWSQEISLVPQSVWNGAPFTADMFAGAPPIVLTNLSPGTHMVEVIGRDSAGVWQDESTAAAVSWNVDTGPALRIHSFDYTQGNLTFQIQLQAGITYSVLFRPSLASGSWQKLVDIPAPDTDDVYTVSEPTTGRAQGFYQVVSPAWP